jgi:hypothetical protein
MDNVADVFKTIGQPTVTYVKRDSGRLEKQLRDALNERGQLCLITGPSKTGKTTLYKEILSERGDVPLVVQCDRSLTVDMVWRKALESVNFERVDGDTSGKTTSVAGEAEIEGGLGWNWLAKAAGRLQVSAANDTSEGETRSRILADPGPDLLIPLLKSTRYILVIEDFHYLLDTEKVTLFQQWKRFIDNEVSVIILGTTHRAVDIANSNKDLLGRISQIDVGHWTLADLTRICHQGFDHLKTSLSNDVAKFICTEAAGLPIIVQQVCQNLFTSRDLITVAQARRATWIPKKDDARSSLHLVARQKYTQFESYYGTLISGPRESARKYRTYELILACFTLDPVKFSLKRYEIDQRLGKMSLSAEDMPPAASLNSTLGALKTFQERRGFELLEWRPAENILYIIEPAFLFYVRWRRVKVPQTTQLDLFEELLVRLVAKTQSARIARPPS